MLFAAIFTWCCCEHSLDGIGPAPILRLASAEPTSSGAPQSWNPGIYTEWNAHQGVWCD